MRKIFVEMADARSKDLVMENVAHVVRCGNNGRPYYVNDDIPESLKRRRADIYKHMKHLESRGYRVERAGDDLIINGQRWHYDELNDLPDGDKLWNSHRVCQYGVIAFQSAVSPFSNLYPCLICAYGFEYNSVEQGYHHQKAIHHRNFDLAHRVLLQSDAYEVMAIAKHQRDNDAWAAKKFTVLETLVKHKADHLPFFHDVLKRSGDCALVENSWDRFWGTGCPFRAPCVWDNTFPGQNQFGLWLQRVCASI